MDKAFVPCFFSNFSINIGITYKVLIVFTCLFCVYMLCVCVLANLLTESAIDNNYKFKTALNSKNNN